MRVTSTILALVIMAAQSPAVDKDKQAAAAFAFAAQNSTLKAKTDRAKDLFAGCSDLAECHCHDTAKCECRPGTCKCCADKLPAFSDQMAKALKHENIIVVYYGTEGKGSCFNGALSAGSNVPAGRSPFIGVGYAKGKSIFLSDELPVDSDRSTIEKAIEKAKQQQKTAVISEPKSPPPVSYWTAPAPVSEAICRT